jgi:hypothetical protein
LATPGLLLLVLLLALFCGEPARMGPCSVTESVTLPGKSPKGLDACVEPAKGVP